MASSRLVVWRRRRRSTPGSAASTVWTNRSSSVCRFSTRCRRLSPRCASRSTTGSMLWPSVRPTSQQFAAAADRVAAPRQLVARATSARRQADRRTGRCCASASAMSPSRIISPCCRMADAVADQLDLAEQVRVEEDRLALLLELLHACRGSRAGRPDRRRRSARRGRSPPGRGTAPGRCRGAASCPWNRCGSCSASGP